MKEKVKKLLFSYRTLPDKKQYVEFFTAILTVPVLLTVIILNLNNLKENKTREKDAPKETIRQIVISPSFQAEKKSIDTTDTPCKKEIGPVTISYPQENDVVPENPVNITIHYEKGNRCAVVWSYRVNNNRWSDYDDISISLYNLSNGQISFDLRVKSIVTSDEIILNRKFVYTGGEAVTPAISQDPISSPSAQQ